MGHDLLLAVHFLGLFMGGAAGIGLPVIGAVTEAAAEAHRPSIGRAVRPLQLSGHIGLGLLIVTGVVLAGMAGSWSGASAWFWVKLAGVAVLVAGVVLAGRAGAKAMAGDVAAAAQARLFGMLNLVAVVVIVVAATLEFH